MKDHDCKEVSARKDVGSFYPGGSALYCFGFPEACPITTKFDGVFGNLWEKVKIEGTNNTSTSVAIQFLIVDDTA